jgi:hypothetical protein
VVNGRLVVWHEDGSAVFVTRTAAVCHHLGHSVLDSWWNAEGTAVAFVYQSMLQEHNIHLACFVIYLPFLSQHRVYRLIVCGILGGMPKELQWRLCIKVCCRSIT